MKNAMKKLTSLLLVAVLLVGALPFAASASTDNYSVTVNIKWANHTDTYNVQPTETLGGIFTWVAGSVGADTAKDGYTPKYWWNDANGGAGRELTADTVIPGNGGTLTMAWKEVVVTNTCDTCKETYTGSEHTCPTLTCNTCYQVYTKGTDHTCVFADITWQIKYKEGGSVVNSGSFTPKGATANVKDILYYHVFNRSNSWQTSYTCTKAYSSLYGTDVGAEGKVPAGDTVTMVLTPVELLDNSSSSNSSSSSNTSTSDTLNSGASLKDQNDIILNIFINKDFNNCKTVKLNDHWTIADDKITTYEILTYVVTDYYKASNTNLGLQCDGMYYSVGAFMYNWLLDNAAVKTDAVDNIAVKRANGTVTINVMITNAVAKTSTAAADTSNPKTGDSIYTAMTVMGVSAAALAAVMFFYNKKRMAL